MINLLPKDTKTDLLYARRNTILLRWITACAFVLIGVGLLVAGGYIYLSQSIENYSKQVDTSRNSLAAQKIEETQKQVEDISNNTKLVTQVLSREILFSKLLRQLGASLPADTTLRQFQVDKLQGGLTLQGAAKNIEAATQLQVNLQDPNNKIFDKADIENINCATTSDSTYPCTVQIRALFSKNNPYLYITPTTGSNKQ
jgi:hypothetical protein